MEEILILIAKIASVALGAGIAVFSCYKIPFFRVRVFFCLSIAGFCLSALFFAEEGALLSWVKHFLLINSFLAARDSGTRLIPVRIFFLMFWEEFLPFWRLGG